MTSDGIKNADWNRVHEAALQVTNATIRADAGSQKRAGRALTDELDRLECKYGCLPSIVATRADFCNNPKLQVRLWTTAYQLANTRADKWNLLLIATSLTEFYVRGRVDVEKGEFWLERMRCHLAIGKADDRRIYRELSIELKNQKSECEQSARAYPPPAARQLRTHLPRRGFRAAQP